MTIKIGVNPNGWTSDDVPEIGGDTPLETCLSEIRQSGYLGTELGCKFPRESRALRDALRPHDLAVVSGWWDGRILDREVDAEFEAVLPHLRLLRDLGAEVVVYADTSRGRHDAIWRPISQRPRLMDDDWPDYGGKLTALAERMAEFGVAMAFHHHMGTIVEAEADVDRLMSVTGPAVGLLHDSGHCAFAGGDPVALARRHARRIVHVHCKDVRPAKLRQARLTDMSFMDSVLEGLFTVPGDGGVDFPAILDILHQAGFAGWLVVEAEQDPNKAHPLTFATMGYDNLAAMARAAGFVVQDRKAS